MAAKDVDGVAFLAKRLVDEDAMEMDVLRIVLSLERCCCCWISGFDDEKIMSFDNSRIYSILIFELYLTGYILKIQKSNS